MKAVNAEIVRGTLVLENGSASLYDLKELLKAHGCKFDACDEDLASPRFGHSRGAPRRRALSKLGGQTAA